MLPTLKNLTEALPEDQALIEGWTTNIINALKGQPNGLAPLDVNGIVPSANLPSVSLTWGSITGTLSDQTDLITALGAKASTDSPAFSGVPTAPNAIAGTNSIQLATTAFVKQAFENTGLIWTPNAPTQTQGDNSTKVANTAYVDLAILNSEYTTAYTLLVPSLLASFSTLAQGTYPKGLQISSDGTKIYTSFSDDDYIRQYTLSTPFDLSTASLSFSKAMAGYDNICLSFTFSPDGTKLYYFGSQYNRVFQFTLTTAWDLSTAVYDSKTYTTTINYGTALAITPNGTKMYLWDGSTIQVLTLSTAWDLATATLTSTTSPSVLGTSIYDLHFIPDGSRVFVANSTTITQYELSIPFDIDSATKVRTLTTPDTNHVGVSMSPNGEYFYASGTSSDKIYQYILI